MNYLTLRILAPLVLFIGTLMLYVPFRPAMPSARLDPSWAMGMNELASLHAMFGRDVVFTFGPLAAVYTTYFHPGTDAWVMTVSASLAMAVLACWRVILSGRSPTLWLGVALICWLCINSRDALLFAVPLLASLATAFWSLDREEACSEPSDWRTPPLLLFAWGTVGILPLIKGTMLVLALALTALTIVFLFAQGRIVMALLVLIVPPSVSMAGWLCVGQELEALPQYLGSMSEIIKGYTEAMAYGLGSGRSIIEVILYVSLAWMLVRRAALSSLPRGIFAASYFSLVLAVSLFLSFKSAFVRHDEGHTTIAMNIALVLVCVAWARFDLPATGRWRWWLIAVLLWLAVMGGVRGWTVGRHLPNWWAGQQASIEAMVDRVFRPSAIPDAFDAANGRIREAHSLPNFTGTMDVYSTNHAVALAHELAWRPRPVLQSYSAYTPALARLNRNHLLGADAPDWIWFTVEPIDRRFAPQEDGASWPVLWRDYDPKLDGSGKLFLKRRVHGPTQLPPVGEVVTRQRIAIGKWVQVPQHAGPLSLSVDIQRNPLGRLLHTLYKARSLRIELELSSGEVRKQRVVSGMLVEPVLLSPVVETTDEFTMLYGDLTMLGDKQVRAMRLVEADRGPSLWEGDYELILRRVDGLGRLANASSQILPYSRMEPVAMTIDAHPGVCKGYIDDVNGARKDGGYVFNAPLLRARGWTLVRSAASGASRPRPFLLLQSKQGSWKLPLTTRPRPDVAAHLGNGAPPDTGWSVFGDVRQLQGDFTLSLAYEEGGAVRRCPDLIREVRRP